MKNSKTSKQAKNNDVGKKRVRSWIPFIKNLTKNDDNIDKAKKHNDGVNNNSLSLDKEFSTALEKLREFVIDQDNYTEGVRKATQSPFLIDNGKSYATDLVLKELNDYFLDALCEMIFTFHNPYE